MNKKTVVVHSGGMDSSLSLALAIREFGAQDVASLTFSYGQRHSLELQAAERICHNWGVFHTVIPLDFMSNITNNALINASENIIHNPGEAPNTLVVGRNGLMARLSAIYAHNLGGNSIYMGVIAVDSANSGYRDCSREYMDMMQDILRIDLDDKDFEIRTPVFDMTKKETMILGYELGVLKYLLQETISCYKGIPRQGCQECPACKLRNEGILEFLNEHPNFEMPYNVLSEMAKN